MNQPMEKLSCDSLRLTNLTVLRVFSFTQQHVNYTLLFALLLDHFKPKTHTQKQTLAYSNKCIDHIVCITMHYSSATNSCKGPPSL